MASSRPSSSVPPVDDERGMPSPPPLMPADPLGVPTGTANIEDLLSSDSESPPPVSERSSQPSPRGSDVLLEDELDAAISWPRLTSIRSATIQIADLKLKLESESETSARDALKVQITHQKGVLISLNLSQAQAEAAIKKIMTRRHEVYEQYMQAEENSRRKVELDQELTKLKYEREVLQEIQPLPAVADVLRCVCDPNTSSLEKQMALIYLSLELGRQGLVDAEKKMPFLVSQITSCMTHAEIEKLTLTPLFCNPKSPIQFMWIDLYIASSTALQEGPRGSVASPPSPAQPVSEGVSFLTKVTRYSLPSYYGDASRLVGSRREYCTALSEDAKLMWQQANPEEFAKLVPTFTFSQKKHKAQIEKEAGYILQTTQDLEKVAAVLVAGIQTGYYSWQNARRFFQEICLPKVQNDNKYATEFNTCYFRTGTAVQTLLTTDVGCSKYQVNSKNTSATASRFIVAAEQKLGTPAKQSSNIYHSWFLATMGLACLTVVGALIVYCCCRKGFGGSRSVSPSDPDGRTSRSSSLSVSGRTPLSDLPSDQHLMATRGVTSPPLLVGTLSLPPSSIRKPQAVYPTRP